MRPRSTLLDMSDSIFNGETVTSGRIVWQHVNYQHKRSGDLRNKFNSKAFDQAVRNNDDKLHADSFALSGRS